MRKTLFVALIIMAFAGAAFADGAAVFTGKCAMCHGKGGAGDTGMGKSMKLRDLGPLSGMQLTQLNLHGCEQVADLGVRR